MRNTVKLFGALIWCILFSSPVMADYGYTFLQPTGKTIAKSNVSITQEEADFIEAIKKENLGDFTTEELKEIYELFKSTDNSTARIILAKLVNDAPYYFNTKLTKPLKKWKQRALLPVTPFFWIKNQIMRGVHFAGDKLYSKADRHTVIAEKSHGEVSDGEIKLPGDVTLKYDEHVNLASLSSMLTENAMEMSGLRKRLVVLNKLGGNFVAAASPVIGTIIVLQVIQSLGILPPDAARIFHDFETSHYHVILQHIWQAGIVNGSLGALAFVVPWLVKIGLLPFAIEGGKELGKISTVTSALFKGSPVLNKYIKLAEKEAKLDTKMATANRNVSQNHESWIPDYYFYKNLVDGKEDGEKFWTLASHHLGLIPDLNETNQAVWDEFGEQIVRSYFVVANHLGQSDKTSMEKMVEAITQKTDAANPFFAFGLRQDALAKVVAALEGRGNPTPIQKRFLEAYNNGVRSFNLPGNVTLMKQIRKIKIRVNKKYAELIDPIFLRLLEEKASEEEKELVFEAMRYSQFIVEDVQVKRALKFMRVGLKDWDKALQNELLLWSILKPVFGKATKTFGE